VHNSVAVEAEQEVAAVPSLGLCGSIECDEAGLGPGTEGWPGKLDQIAWEMKRWVLHHFHLTALAHAAAAVGSGEAKMARCTGEPAAPCLSSQGQKRSFGVGSPSASMCQPHSSVAVGVVGAEAGQSTLRSSLHRPGLAPAPAGAGAGQGGVGVVTGLIRGLPALDWDPSWAREKQSVRHEEHFEEKERQ